jgi:hypothetical protein
MTIKTQGGKVITKDGKVSCECCCPCDDFECWQFSRGFSIAIRPTTNRPPEPPASTITIEAVNPITFEQFELFTAPLTYHGQFGSGWDTDAGKPPPFQFFLDPPGVTIWTGWRRHDFCMRFLCRTVNDESENGTVSCSRLTCGPTVNQISLTDELFQNLGARSGKSNLLSTETQSGIYVYCFEFFGWKQPSWFESKTGRETPPVPRDDAYKLYSFYYNPNN